MAWWQIPRWYGQTRREQQLDDHVARTGRARFGLREMERSRKAEAVREHFDRVAPRYDFMNSLLSFGIQHQWKRAAVRRLDLKPGQRVADICGGTADLALLAARAVGPTGRVVVYDINAAMLAEGRVKVRQAGMENRILFVQGDAERIALSGERFDAAMVGFGIRNVTHLKRSFREMHRLLRPGGRLMCLEFSRPVNPVFRELYDFYSFNIMPLLGQMIAGSARSYACLSETIRMFLLPDELSGVLEEVGCRPVGYHRMTNGIAVVHVGHRPAEGPGVRE